MTPGIRHRLPCHSTSNRFHPVWRTLQSVNSPSPAGCRLQPVVAGQPAARLSQGLTTPGARR
jgi:hypothetical protein